MAIGYSDLKNVIRLPGNWDAGYLQQWALKDGTTFDQVVRDIGAAIILFNQSLLSGYYAQYFRVTTDAAVEDMTGGEGGSELQPMSEYTKPDPLRGDVTGHMIPMLDFGGALGWTHLALRRALRGRIDNDIMRLIERSRNTWDKKLLTRLFKSTADTVGGTGVSAPFADGGTADSNYVPPTNGGRSFLSTHSHFLRYADDSSGRIAAIKAQAAHLAEHGLSSPWELVIPEVDEADWTALTDSSAKFVKPQRLMVDVNGTDMRSNVSEETYIGVIETDKGYFRVKSEPRLPTNYAGWFKPQGLGSPNSPLVVRYEDGFPLGLALVGQVVHYPLEEAIAMFTFGVGVGDRVSGGATYFYSSGDYVSPTIS